MQAAAPSVATNKAKKSNPVAVTAGLAKSGAMTLPLSPPPAAPITTQTKVLRYSFIPSSARLAHPMAPPAMTQITISMGNVPVRNGG